MISIQALDLVELRTATICVDDRCPILGIHPAHVVARSDHNCYTCRTPIRDATLATVRDYEVKVFGQIYDDVVSDLGHVDRRAVQRALQSLTEERTVALVAPRGARRRYRRLDRVSGGYIRYSSPLLFDVEGMQCLLDQVEDAVAALRHARW
jgi:hypothetical protein